ncbi:MAG: CpsD/CapB family tyrosine-protein kinase [Anaerolineae bacterium]|jgi:non-specific protein-tyrosine kinase|nr:CpsD/CapB family tyrosine-protein kinase [Anaerolineae bacterium]
MTLNLATLTAPTSAVAEAYRRLRVNLMSADKEQPLCAILVAAAGPSKDKPQVVANLAVAYAKVGQRVIVVDCDLRHPAQHTLFNVPAAEGVTTAIRNPEAALPLQATELPGLTVLPAGPNVDVPSDLLASPAMARLVRRLATEADVVLFDAPPVTVATDAAELATVVDGVLLTVTAGVTKRDEAQRAKELLDQVGARVVGAALVNVAAEAAVREYLAA